MLQASQLAFYFQTPTISHIYTLHQPSTSNYKASNSTILSLVSHLLVNYPDLPHPYQEYQHIQIQLPFDKMTIEQCSLVHPLFEPWCDLLTENIFKGQAFRHQQTLYIAIEISQQYSKHLSERNFVKTIKDGLTCIEQIFGIQKIEMGKKRKIALPNFAGSQLRTNKLQPKIHIPALLMGIFYDNQQWDYYPILKGEIPNVDQLTDHDVIILPGSTLSVLNRHPKVLEFMEVFKQAYETNPNLRVLSICFGHQLICDLYKAKILQKERKVGQEEVKFNSETINKYSFLKPLVTFKEKSCLMPEHHEDYVMNIPEGFDLVGESESCQIQCVIKKDGRIMSMQFHPEYFAEYATVFSLRQLSFGNEHEHLLHFDFGIDKKILQIHHESCTQFRKCMKLFLGGQ